MIRALVAFGTIVLALGVAWQVTRIVRQPWLPDPTPALTLRRDTAVPVAVPPPLPPLPDSHLLIVPFILQAPYSVWDPLHEEACEEASLLMVWHYYRGDTVVDKATAEHEIKALVAYEETRGYGVSITLAELAAIAADHLPLTGGAVTELRSFDQVKEALVAGQPVIVGAAGKLLQNPYFRNGGPNYHMLVLTGYTPEGFITNDPGIGRGHGYKYQIKVLEQAIHDWNPTDITQGARRFLTFPSPKQVPEMTTGSL